MKFNLNDKFQQIDYDLNRLKKKPTQTKKVRYQEGNEVSANGYGSQDSGQGSFQLKKPKK